jgi:uncharacterized protein involved in outer membrane biogenesis
VHIDRLLPKSEKIAQAAGQVGGALKLKGTGNSIADAAAKAEGSIAVTMSQGHVSNLLDALSGLNGGKVLMLLVGGDRQIAVNCGGIAFDVKGGRGNSTLFVVDTEQTQILGRGTFDLEHERFDIVVAPKPKRAGVLSLRSPVRLYGTFRQPDFAIEKGPLMARAGGSLALAAVGPLAALLPLIETGPGQDTDCGAVRSQVGTTAKPGKQASPAKPGKQASPKKSR